MAQLFETCFRMDPGFDFVLMTSGGIVASIVTYYIRPDPFKKPERLKNKQYKLTLVEWLLISALIIVTLTNIVLRFIKGVPYWLVQPCHLASFLLIYVVIFAEHDTNLFHYYYYSVWMPVIGLLSPPNASWFTWWWEPHNFYVHHLLLLGIAYYYLFINHRFHPHLDTASAPPAHYMVDHITDASRRFKFFNHLFGYGVIYHTTFLTYLGLWLDEDFDAMRCRFGGGEIFGIHWREALMVLCYIASIIFVWIPDVIVHRTFKAKNKQLANKHQDSRSYQKMK
ncbi:hypothetical protein SAMD00019534_087260 [Acytostelium subglobosum LB1]|uniref:hypothetical protein n=1 Tax=Acytostelium subglobosum LB1 TaxID=1410327 RepID=UPI000644D5F0|nr:hypothetical protein SAMD00019534_087260 [Acytostelium subglobosum LB1]GAM25551.1 hypothetical protein SAMD00019534_087260 [Acytostelium subglobosum LB1]|eukprot:XP_012751537.1 hypothetical protein SAMD00019534_087260 [Acytostelium subglobosum LB1]